MFIGIDLHKEYAQVAVMDETGQIVEETRLQNEDLDEFAQQYAGATAAIEATSNYYHIQKTLSEHLDVTVGNPSELDKITHSDTKTDRVDAKQLARLARLEAVPESYVPSEDIRECRALVRGREKLKQHRTAHANRVQSLLNQQGITHNLKPLSETGRQAIRQLSLPTVWAEVIEASLNVIEALTDQMDRLEEVIQERAASFSETQLLMSIPGVSHLSALAVFAEIGDIDRFDSHKQLVSYVGLNPVIRESGDSRFEGSISKNGPGHVRWILGQSAHVAVHTCKDEYFKQFHDRLERRKSSQEAIVATARKLLVSMYYMLEREEVYDPPGVSS